MKGALLGRLAVVAVFVAVVVAWFALDLGRFLNLQTIVDHKDRLLAEVEARPLLAGGVYVAVYFCIAAFSLPAATAMTLAGGFLFGRALGTVLVVGSATAGASLAFLAARYLLGGWVQQRFQGKAFQALNDGVRANGLNYLLFVRLVPLFPFFLINLVCGLTPMTLRTFVLGTAVGIVPGSFLYVNAGRELSRITAPGDIFSVPVLGSFALLGLFALVPVVWKRFRGGPRTGAA